MKTDIIALIVFFMMGFNLCIPVIQKQFTDEATIITVNADSPLDNTSPAYDYWHAPENSFGIQETKTVNWSYFKQLFNDHFYKNARYKRYSYSEWTDGTEYLSLNKTWNESGFWKVDIILDIPVDLYSVNVSFGCDLTVLNYIEREGYEIWLNYTANATETYQIMFNWSDIAQIPNLEISKHRQDGKFWISFKRDNVPSGYYVFDPVFGENTIGTNCYYNADNDDILLGRFYLPVSAELSDVAFYTYYYGSATNARCLLYNEDLTFVAQTNEVLVDNAAAAWINFTWSSNPSIDAGWYFLGFHCDGTVTNAVYYCKDTTGGHGQLFDKDNGHFYPSYNDPLDNDTYLDDNLLSLWCSYTEGAANTAPTQSLQKIWNSTTSTEKSFNATGVSLTPTCFNVTVADIDADQMNVTIKTNESGTWTTVNTTTSGMTNGTYHGYNTSWVDSYNTKYWISFNVSDDSDWCNETFNFTTETGPWSNTAPVQSAFTINDLGNNSVDIGRYPQLNITVVDADGNNTVVYWGTNGSAKYQINGSAGNRTCRDINFSFASAYNIKYYVEISVNDTHDNVTKWYCFTTESEAWSNTAPTLTNEIPTNASTDISRWCQLNITVTDADGNNSKVYWYTNASGGVWYLLQTNTSVLNTTVRLMNFTNASSYSTKYWWKVSANDTHDNTTEIYYFTTGSEDTTPPNITINFAGNLSDSGGPYWRPPGETDILDEAGEGVWRDGYYTNDSRQSEDWIYINVTANDSESSVTNVWLQWLNETTWINYTYAFVNTVGEYWEYNTSGNIQTCEGYNYSFNIVANSTGGTNTTYWNKTGIGESYTRRTVQLNCTKTNISYTPYYAKWITYGASDINKHDRLQHDQGGDGTTSDTVFLNADETSGSYATCAAFIGAFFGESTCITPFTLNNVYFHWWIAVDDGAWTSIGWNKQRTYLDNVVDNSYSGSQGAGDVRSDQDVPGGILSGDNHIYLTTNLLTVDAGDYNFTDNNINELVVKLVDSSTPGLWSNRSCNSFVLFNIPDNATLNASHADTDSDGLSDWTELYVTYTNPFLADTDNDGVNDYDENLAGSDPNNYTSMPAQEWVVLDTWNITLGNMSVSPYTLDTWNITIGNSTITPYTLDTWNLTLGNLTISSFTIDTWNITLSNTTTGTRLDTWNLTIGNSTIAPYTLDTWNITLGNTTTGTVLDTWNLTIGNSTITPYTLDTWNITLGNTTTGTVLDTWNLTIGNLTLSSFVIDQWNLTFSNTTTGTVLETWNVTLGNMSISPVILDTWNLTLSNLTISPYTLDTWNITLSNTPISYTLDTWNVTLSNTTLSYVLDTWNITLSNTSLFIIANITATPSTGTVSSTIINITCNVTSTNAIVNVTVNMTGGTYDMSNIGDLYYYASIYNIVGIHYYHIYANDTSGDQLESSVYSFEITGLSCSFTYVVKGSVVTVTPTIVSSTYYKWTVEHNSETEWIPIADIGDHKFVFPYGGKYRIILTAKNETASVDCSRLITAKASFVEPEPDEEIPEEEKKPGLRNVYTDTGISDWIEDRNLGEFILIGVIVLIALLAIIKRRPKKFVIYPIIKEKKGEKNE